MPVRTVCIPHAGPLLVLAVCGLGTAERTREVRRRGECCFILLRASRQSYGDFLKQPAIAVGVAEGGERDVAAPRRIASAERRLSRTGPVENLAHVDTATDEFGTAGLDVGHDKVISRRARRGGRDSCAEVDRAWRAGRGELHDSKRVTDDEIGVEPPSQVAVKPLGAIDVRNRDDYRLELHAGCA